MGKGRVEVVKRNYTLLFYFLFVLSMIGGLALRDTFSYSMMVGGGIGLTFLFCSAYSAEKEKEACELMVRRLLYVFCTTILFINAGRNFKRMNAVRIRAVLILTKYNGNAATCVVKLIFF